MAKVKLDYMSLSMRAEGSDDMVRELSGRFLDMADKYAAPGFYFPALPPSVFEDGCRDPEELNTGDMKPLTTPKEVAPGADWDVVAIYDNAGIPSIMHRFRRMSNKELFGGSDKPHPAFIIGGEVSRLCSLYTTPTSFRAVRRFTAITCRSTSQSMFGNSTLLN